MKCQRCQRTRERIKKLRAQTSARLAGLVAAGKLVAGLTAELKEHVAENERIRAAFPEDVQ